MGLLATSPPLFRQTTAGFLYPANDWLEMNEKISISDWYSSYSTPFAEVQPVSSRSSFIERRSLCDVGATLLFLQLSFLLSV